MKTKNWIALENVWCVISFNRAFKLKANKTTSYCKEIPAVSAVSCYSIIVVLFKKQLPFLLPVFENLSCF